MTFVFLHLHLSSFYFCPSENIKTFLIAVVLKLLLYVHILIQRKEIDKSANGRFQSEADPIPVRACGSPATYPGPSVTKVRSARTANSPDSPNSPQSAASIHQT